LSRLSLKLPLGPKQVIEPPAAVPVKVEPVCVRVKLEPATFHETSAPEMFETL